MPSHPTDWGVPNRLVGPFYIFNANYEELQNALRLNNSPAAMKELMPLKYRYRHNDLLEDIKMLIVNYVAAAKMMVEHTRIAMKSGSVPRDVVEAFEEKRKALVTNNFGIATLHLLNDYYAHYFSHPLTSIQDFNRSFEDGLARFTVDRKSLIQFAGRKREQELKLKHPTEHLDSLLLHLASLSEDVELDKLVMTYHTEVNDFYIWLLKLTRPA